MTSTSSVAFPQDSVSKGLDEASNTTPVKPLRPPHLPFRRISLPGISRVASNLASNRLSMASTTSLESTSVGEPYTPSVSGESSKQAGSPRTRRRYTSSNHRLSRSTTMNQEMKEKRRKIVNEILSTEQAYVSGLDLIYTNFLTPLIESLDTDHPILSRSEITTLFSNFIDIWNFNRSFLTSLTNSLSNQNDLPQLSQVFVSHFPYLSLYTPFITSFPSVLTNLVRLIDSNPTFADFIRKQEADPRCGKLTLGDWLLTIVQRCPRYLLLLKDLISCTDPSDPEYRALLQVHVILSKITQSLNTSLHVHSQTISLLSLQRAIVNLPFQLVQPGRVLIRRGSLFQGQTEKDSPAFREFLLFSDYLIWLTLGDERLSDERLRRPILSRGRSRSETELLNSSPKKMRTSSEEKWTCKGHIALVDLEVVIAPSEQDKSERARFDVLSPHISFAVYAETEDERELWVTDIRNAKAALLASLNTMLTNSTLTSSHATTHLRRVLQALPDEEDSDPSQKRGRVDHFLPAVWVPDSKTDSCMRCNIKFSWLKRRHHCRLCGRCVCADCSAKTFFISDTSTKDTKRARSCNACYETVFPVIQSSSDPKRKNHGVEARGGVETTPNSSKGVTVTANAMHADNTDIDDTLEDLPDFHSIADETAVRNPPLRLLKPSASSVHPEFGFEDLRPRPLSQPVMKPIDVDIDVDVASDSFHIASLSDNSHITRIGRRPSFSKLQSSIPQLRHRVSSAALAVTPEIITGNPAVSSKATGLLRGRRSSLALNGKKIAHMDPIEDDNTSLVEDVEYGQAIDKLGEILNRGKI